LSEAGRGIRQVGQHYRLVDASHMTRHDDHEAEDGQAGVLAPRRAEPQAWRDVSRPASERVTDLLGRMTLAEKAGQLYSTWPGDNGTHQAAFWVYRHFQDRVVHLWEALAGRYRDNPAVAGYNIMNEPADAAGDLIKPFYDRVIGAVRQVDPDHIIFLDGNRYATDFSAFENAPLYPNTVYTAHDYALPGFVYGGPYPGVTQGVFVDRGQVEDTFLRRTEFMRSTGTPIWIGELGPVFTGDPARDDQRYRLLQDQLDIYQQYGAGWSIWAYKDVGGQGLVSAAPDSPWRERIRDVMAKKARLGVDSWGSLDTRVRHIMAPIEKTLAEEYPDFDPYPFGQASWLMTLVRGIMLAEPMLDDFGQCFADVTRAETIRELADSFRWENCMIRERLADVLSAAARGRG
jgi:hypothetical protein